MLKNYSGYTVGTLADKSVDTVHNIANNNGWRRTTNQQKFPSEFGPFLKIQNIIEQ